LPSGLQPSWYYCGGRWCSLLAGTYIDLIVEHVDRVRKRSQDGCSRR
jgi:hypothetical protein